MEIKTIKLRDLAGSWIMSNGEAEKMMMDIKTKWKKWKIIFV